MQADEQLLRWELHREPERMYLALFGELDMAASAELEPVVQGLVTNGLPVTIDLARVSFLDGGGLSVLMDAVQRLTDHGVTATFGRSPQPVLRYLELSGRSLVAG